MTILSLSAASAQTPDLTRRLQSRLDDWRDAHEIIGVSLAIITASGEQLELASGFANPDTQRSLHSNNAMYVGSITKTFVAAAALHLVEEGKLELTTPIDAWYPAYPHATSITVAQLLSMTSGTYDYFRNAPDNAFLPLVMADVNRKWTPDEIIAAVAELPHSHLPGEAYDYSNTNYLMLGQIIEAISGQAVAEVLRERFFEPLDLTTSQLTAATLGNTQLANGYARGSAFLFGQEGPLATDASHYQGLETVFGTAGGLISTPVDLATFLHALVTGDLLTETSRSVMLEPTAASLAKTAGYGYGLEWFDTAHGRAVGHAGSIPGYASLTLHVPPLGVTLSVTTNDEQGEAALASLLDTLISEIQDKPDRHE